MKGGGFIAQQNKGNAVRKKSLAAALVIGVLLACSLVGAQEKKPEKIRVGGGSASATQMALWLAKEGNYYEKHGLNVEAISIPGS